MEMHAAGRLHHDPHMTSREDHTSASAHANAGGSHAHRHASHGEHAHHREKSGVPHYMQETDNTEARHTGHAGHAVLHHKQSKVGKKTHKAELRSASGVQLKRAKEGKVGVEGAGDKPKRISKKHDYPTMKAKTKTNSKTVVPVASPPRSPLPSRHPHSETREEK